MPYRNGPVPSTYTPAFFERELQRIAEAYDFQECIGGLAIFASDTPVVQALTATPINMNCWVQRTQKGADGPVQADQRVSPVGEIEVLQDGIFLMTWYINFTHAAGESFGFGLYLNGNSAGIGAGVDASQQSTISGLTMSGQIPLSKGDIITTRAASLEGDESVTYDNGALQVIKLRDLRTRFS